MGKKEGLILEERRILDLLMFRMLVMEWNGEIEENARNYFVVGYSW